MVKITMRFRKVKVGMHFNDGFAAKRMQYELLKRKPRSVKVVSSQPDVFLEFLVGNPYLESKENIIRRAESRDVEHVFWLFYSQADDDTPMPEHFENSKAIISTLTSIESRYPHNTHMIPLGADPSIFYNEDRHREYLVHTHGFDVRAESIEFVHRACKSHNQKQCHIGSDFDTLNDDSIGELDESYIDIFTNITDDEMRTRYNLSRFVAGLRLIEGFEMPVVEGAMCGCRPLVYDLPCYTRWFSEFATLIPFQGEPDKSGPPFGNQQVRIAKLVDSIKSAFETGDSLNHEEISLVKEKFNWDCIISKVWEAILK